MAYRADWISLIRQLAPRYGVDPLAALAVAASEGLGGGVGDAGTSFGPFQLHVGGALPSGRGQSWAESPAGIEYALGQIGAVSQGLSGQAAVANIVRRFERPADPGGEIARALASYGHIGGGAALAQPQTQAFPPFPASAAPASPEPGLSMAEARATLADALLKASRSGDYTSFYKTLARVRAQMGAR